MRGKISSSLVEKSPCVEKSPQVKKHQIQLMLDLFEISIKKFITEEKL